MHAITFVNLVGAVLAFLSISKMWRWRDQGAAWLICLALGVIALNGWFVIRDLFVL